MRCVLFLSLVLSAACSVDSDRFVVDLTTQDCSYALQCFDDPVLTFYGWTDQAACEAEHGPTIAALAASCTYDKKAARDCLKALDERPCAGDPASGDLARPAVCAEVFTSCEGGDTGGADGVDTDDTDV